MIHARSSSNIAAAPDAGNDLNFPTGQRPRNQHERRALAAAIPTLRPHPADQARQQLIELAGQQMEFFFYRWQTSACSDDLAEAQYWLSVMEAAIKARKAGHGQCGGSR